MGLKVGYSYKGTYQIIGTSTGDGNVKVYAKFEDGSLVFQKICVSADEYQKLKTWLERNPQDLIMV